MAGYPSDVSDEEWALLAPFLLARILGATRPVCQKFCFRGRSSKTGRGR